MSPLTLVDDRPPVIFYVFVPSRRVPNDLDLWPFDPETVSWTVPHMPNPHTNFDNTMLIADWVMNLSVTEFDHISLAVIITTSMRRVTWPVIGENNRHFWNPNPDLPIHFVIFGALQRTLTYDIVED